MTYVGHFSFSFDSKPKRKHSQSWHGYFTAVVEAANVEGALKRLEALVLKSADTSELFSDVSEIFLESCIELKTIPRAGFLAHVALEEGESLGSISTTLPGVKRSQAASYHFEPEEVDDDGGFDAQPFVVLKKAKTVKKSAEKKGDEKKSAAKKSATKKTAAKKNAAKKSAATKK